MIENIDYVVCPICQKQMKELKRHIEISHNMDMLDFYKIYPDRMLICSILSEKRKKGSNKTFSIMKNKTNKKNEEKRKIYNETPNLCKNCNTKIEYNKRNNKYCNTSCAAICNNKNRTVTENQKIKTSNTLKSIRNIYDEYGKIVYKSGRHCNIQYSECKKCKSLFVKKYYMKSQFCKNCIHIAKSENMVKLNNKNGNRNLWHQYKIESKIYGNISVDSSWEVLLIQILEDNFITWIKPKIPFVWIDKNNKSRKYYPDFYLPDHDIYIETKNEYLCKIDNHKIEYVKSNYDINLILLNSKKSINIDNIKSIINIYGASEVNRTPV